MWDEAFVGDSVGVSGGEDGGVDARLAAGDEDEVRVYGHCGDGLVCSEGERSEVAQSGFEDIEKGNFEAYFYSYILLITVKKKIFSLSLLNIKNIHDTRTTNSGGAVP